MIRFLGRSELDLPVSAIKYSHQNIPSGYLRISINDNCNMKCSYCHNEGQLGIKGRRMTVAQLRYIAERALRYGLTKVRLTGGEPLLHPDCHAMLRMLKREMAIPTVGFNSNGSLMNRLLPMIEEKLIDDLVIGLDYLDGEVSKDSPVGVSSYHILQNIMQLKEYDQNVSIACVYDGNYDRLERLAAWCIDHNVALKILQETTKNIETEICSSFVSMIEQIVQRFSLEVGIIGTFSEYYSMKNGNPVIYFFHSHCRVRECGICGRIHVRVTADGYIKTCIQDDTEFPLLSGQFDESMLKVLATLGIAPEARQEQEVKP